VVEVHLVALVARVEEAGVAEHAGLVLLAVLADPHDVVLLEGVLAHLVRRRVPHLLDLDNTENTSHQRIPRRDVGVSTLEVD
jgi:hypothetical protein